MDGWLVRNQTPARLRLVGGGSELLLAPLQTRPLAYPPSALGAAEEQAVQAGALAWDALPPREVRERWAALALLVAGSAAAWLLVSGLRGAWGQAGAAGTVLVLSALVLPALNRLERKEDDRGWRLRRGSRPPARPGEFNSWDFARGVVQRVLHTLLLVLVVVVGLAVPAAALWYGTGLGVLLQAYDSAADPALVARELVARGLQLLFIGMLVLLPALMYFWFDREKVETLLDRWLHHIFRFDPTLSTLVDVDAKYGRRLEEAYGTAASGVGVRFRQGARSRAPVVVATLLLAFGWVIVLVNVGGELLPQDVPATEEQARDRTEALFAIATTPLSFAFLGAYAYALQVVLRGYVRGDLRPKTYNAISVRIVIAFVLAGVLQGVLPDEGAGQAVALATAFAAGFVPDTIVRQVLDLGLARAGRGEAHGLSDRWALTELAGIDLYERTRLAEEGITNVQALAHHDVVALTLSTRIPFERVVNWVDQAVLHEHVGPEGRAALRDAGVTTATALLEVHRASPVALQEAVPRVRVPLVVAALQRADWVPMLVAWRGHRQTSPAPVRTFPQEHAHAAPAPPPQRADAGLEPAGAPVPDPRRASAAPA